MKFFFINYSFIDKYLFEVYLHSCLFFYECYVLYNYLKFLFNFACLCLSCLIIWTFFINKPRALSRVDTAQHANLSLFINRLQFSWISAIDTRTWVALENVLGIDYFKPSGLFEPWRFRANPKIPCCKEYGIN